MVLEWKEGGFVWLVKCDVSLSPSLGGCEDALQRRTSVPSVPRVFVQKRGGGKVVAANS